jgi:hypothetical protein
MDWKIPPSALKQPRIIKAIISPHSLHTSFISSEPAA